MSSAADHFIEVATRPMAHDAELLAAAAGECAGNNDRVAFNRILRDWQWLYQVTLREARTYIGQLAARGIATGNIPFFRDAARKLGMDSEARILETLHEQLRQELEYWSNTEFPTLHPNQVLVRTRGACLAPDMLPLKTPNVKHPPLLTEADVLPGRMMDHALVDRFFAAALWVLLGVCGGLTVLLQRELAIRRLAQRITGLLHPSDWWILSCGVLLPVAWYVVDTRFTPWTSREWSLRLPGTLIFLGQHLALVLLLLLAPLTLVRWRVGRRAAALGFGARWLWVDRLALMLLGLAVPGISWVVTAEAGDSGLAWSFALLLGIPCLWLMGLMVRCFIASGSQSLRWTAVTLSATPAWVVAMLLCGIALPFHHAEERYWTQRERIMSLPPDSPGDTRYEAMLVARLRAETQTKLKPLEALDLE